MKRATKTALVIFLGSVLSLQSNCSRRVDPEDIVVAKIGDRIITVGQFRSNYEFGLPHLKVGPDRKRAYLNYMVMEEILSEEGFKRGFDKSDRVRDLEQDLLDELLVEELFQKEIKDKIKITYDQIREAVNRSKVQWKVRYWAEPNEVFADRVAAAMKEQGYAPVLEDILKRNPEVKLNPKDFESDYLTWLDLSEDVLDAIKNVAIGDISDPVKIDGSHFIFQVTDIRREPVREYDYIYDAEKYRQILFYRELKKRAAVYVSSYMKDKNVVTKGSSFTKIANGLAEWKRGADDSRNSFLEAIERAGQEHPALAELKENLDKVLVTFKGGSWTIKEFLAKFDPKSVKAAPDDKQKFLANLNRQIGLSVRDHFLIQKARKMNLQKSKSVQEQLTIWRNKWVYEESRRFFTRGLRIDETMARSYFEKYRDRYKIRWDDNPSFEEYKNQAIRDAYILAAKNLLTAKVDSLKSFFPVQLYQSVLDTITVIESQKSRWQSLQVYKRSSYRLATPIVDPAWGL